MAHLFLQTMHQQTLTLPNGETVLFAHSYFYTESMLSQNDQLLHFFIHKTALETGSRIALGSGETIYLRLMHGELEVWHKGVDLVSGLPSGSSLASSPRTKKEIALDTLLGIFGELALCSIFFLLLLTFDYFSK
jgi:hypothetical protein